MKIRFIQTASASRQCFIKDREYDVPDVEAQSFIRSGIAAEAAEPPAAAIDPKAEPATPNRKRREQ